MACRYVLGMQMTSFSLVFVESKAPHCVRVVTLKDEDLMRGEKQCRVALRLFSECLKADHWPGPGGDQSDAEYLELPTWEQGRIDDRLRLELND